MSESRKLHAHEVVRDEPDRGRDAARPGDVPSAGWKDVGARVLSEFSRDHVLLVAAGVAFYGLLAIFPAITALMSITGLIYAPDELVSALEGIRSLVPGDVATLILDQARNVAGAGDGGLTLGLILGLALALWSASAGVASLIEGINLAYDETETRGFVKLRGMTILLTLGIIVGIVLAAALIVGVPIALNVFAISPLMETAIRWLSYVPLLLLVLGGLAVLYRVGPDRQPATWRWLSPGAVVATVLWLVASLGFRYYVQNFGSYNETFGSVAGIIVMLTWLWITAAIVLLGAEINSELEAQTTRDTTTGPQEPMGARGAVKADRVGKARG